EHVARTRFKQRSRRGRMISIDPGLRKKMCTEQTETESNSSYSLHCHSDSSSVKQVLQVSLIAPKRTGYLKGQPSNFQARRKITPAIRILRPSHKRKSGAHSAVQTTLAASLSTRRHKPSFGVSTSSS